MRVLFVCLGSEQLGVSQLISIVKRAGHEVDLAYSASMFNDRFNLEVPSLARIFNDDDVVKDKILEVMPDVVAFSCLTATYQWCLSIAKFAKDVSDCKVIMGGVHISAEPDLALAQEFVDYVVIGEGDVAIIKILEHIAVPNTNPIVNTRYKIKDGSIVKGPQEGFIQDLDSLPFPDKGIWTEYVRVNDLYLIMASRGCPYTCSFCFNNFFARLPDGKRGKYVRQRSVEHVIAELKIAKEKYHAKVIDFQDDVFTVDKIWIKEFCERYKQEIDLPFQCLIHPKYFDEEICSWMSAAGCTWIQMGIQTMDETFKHEQLRRYEDSNHILNALMLMKKYKIKVKVDQMLGLPGEPIESQEVALKLYKEFTPDRIQTFWTCFLPGTDMFKQAIKDNLISEQQADRLRNGVDFYFFRNQSNISDKVLVRKLENYEFIYRILPALPLFLKKSISIDKVDKIPNFLKRPISFLLDIYIGLTNNNPEFKAYALHYINGMRLFIKRKLFPKRKTKRPLNRKVEIPGARKKQVNTVEHFSG